MATKISESESGINIEIFIRAKIDIELTFQSLIQKLMEKRDQLLLQLHEMKVNFLSKEETRIKQIKDLDQLISGLQQTTVEQNIIVNLQEEHIEKIKHQKQEFEQPTLTPVPYFDRSHLEELQNKISLFGTLQDVSNPYKTKNHPSESIGKEGSGKREFDGIRTIVLDAESSVFISDSINGRIQVVNSEGQYIREIGKGELGFPIGLSLYGECLFVTDTRLNKVLKFKLENDELECKSDLKLKNPFGLTADSDELFVADRNNDRVVVLNLKLQLIREIGNKKLKTPNDVKVNTDKVFVANDSQPHNIIVFSRTGDVLNSIISLRDGTGFMFMCWDRFSNLLVSDCAGRTIRIYTMKGQLVHSIECKYLPTGIAVTQDNTIISADNSNSMIRYY